MQKSASKIRIKYNITISHFQYSTNIDEKQALKNIQRTNINEYKLELDIKN